MKNYLMILKILNKFLKINIEEKYLIETIYKLSNKRVSILANGINGHENIIFINSIKTGKFITKIYINDKIKNVTELKITI